MNSNSNYRLNPKFAWISGSFDQIWLFEKEKPKIIHLDGVDAILWRCIWQRLPPEICSIITDVNNEVITQALNRLLKAGFVTEDC